MTAPTPVDVPPSLFWDGNDGDWSTLHVQVGTNEVDGVHTVLTELDPQNERQVELYGSDAIPIARECAQRHELL